MLMPTFNVLRQGIIIITKNYERERERKGVKGE